jgi:uncharacterized membrane protein YtjA (UPF0391 family)
MLQYAISFLIIALIAAFLGFGGLAAVSIELARIVFGVFILLFLIATVAHIVRGGKSPMPPVL